MQTSSRRENWSEHQKTMFSSLHEKQQLGKYCDVILKCQDSDQTFNAHSCVLSSSSHVFDKLLQEAMEKKSQNVNDNSSNKLVLHLPEDVTSSCVESLLNFIYSGNIDLSRLRTSYEENASHNRRSRRNSSSKHKPPDSSSGSISQDSIDISLLYAFLKASRCLEIMTLTEYLESAVTLSEMKTSKVSSPEKPRRPSAIKYQDSVKPSSVNDNKESQNVIESPKRLRSKKKKQEVKSPKKRNGKAMSPDKDSANLECSVEIPGDVNNNQLRENTEMVINNLKDSGMLKNFDDNGSDAVIQLQEDVEAVESLLSAETVAEVPLETREETLPSSNQSTRFMCQVCKQTFRSRTALKKHSSQHVSDEQANQVDSFPVRIRGNKPIQCKSCDKTFTSPSVLQLHMQKHEAESNQAAKENLGGAAKPDGSVQILRSVEGLTNNETGKLPQSSVASVKSGELVTPERPPRRASALKFANMMKTAFASELGESSSNARVSPKQAKKGKKRQSHEYDNTKIEKPKSLKRKTRSIAKNKDNQASECTAEILPQAGVSQYGSSSAVAGAYTTLPFPESVIAVKTYRETEDKDLTPPPLINALTIAAANNIPANTDIEDVKVENGQPKLAVDENDLFEGFGTVQEYALSDAPIESQTQSDVVRGENASASASPKKSRKKPTNITDKEEETSTCEICGKSLANEKKMMNHIKSHKRPDLACPVCNQQFKYQSSLTKHLQWHKGDPQNCQVCEDPIHSQQERSQHLVKHNSKKMRTECPVCQKSFTSDYVMQLHLRTHTGDELFKCDECGKKFPYKSSLKMHLKLHSGERPYICSVCGKCFVQKIHAKEHELQHAGIRRFQCHLCDRFFAHKCGLSRHVADIHNKSRPYVCNVCSKRFPRKTKLIEHIRTHTGERPYVCDICGTRYKANRSLKSHKKNRHNIIVPDYLVGIWRNGPLPEEEKREPHKPQRQKFRVSLSETFDFPVEVNSVEIDDDGAGKDEEMIVDNIANEVDVISETVPADMDAPVPTDAIESVEEPSKDCVPQQFSYPMPVSTEYDQIRYAPVTSPEMTIYQSILPPASSLSKTSNATIQGQKTFIVPLNANSTVPVMTDQGQVPGMVVTYMMPQPAAVGTAEEVTVAGGFEIPASHMPRSASVPPMSTFRRNSALPTEAKVSFPQVTHGTTTLPGMHTFQPVQLHVPTNQHLITSFTSMPAGFPVLVPATPMLTAVPRAVTEIIENSS